MVFAKTDVIFQLQKRDRQMNKDREVLTTKQACEYLQITSLTLYKLIKGKKNKMK